MNRFVAFCFLILPFFLNATTTEIDSLKNILGDSEGVEKVDILTRLVYLYNFINLDVTLDFEEL